MRFAKVKLTFSTTESFTFPLDDGILTSPFVVKSIDGLDPPPISVAVSQSIYEGGVYQGKRPENREITLLMGFQPDYSIGENAGDLRSQLYSMLTPKMRSDLTFSLLDSSDVVLAYTTGQIKKFEAPIFSKDPEVQIVIPCFSSYFVKDRYTVPSPGTLTKNPLTVTHLGNAPTGFKLQVTLTANQSTFSVTNEVNNEWLAFTYAFETGDVITFNTHAGQRTATLLRDGVTSSLLQYLSANSIWFQMHGGVNKFIPSTTSFTLNEISWIPRFWGV